MLAPSRARLTNRSRRTASPPLNSSVMPLMTVLANFAAARDDWHRHYLNELASYQAKFQPGGPEVMLQLSDNGQPHVFRLYRVDMASGATTPPNLSEVNLPPIADTGAQEYVLSSGLTVELHPIHWNGVEFFVDRMSLDGQGLQTWCAKWLDIDEVGPLNEHGLLGAIHSATAPEAQSGGVTFSIDFGSAPVLAVEELFSVLRQLGATRVRVSSPWGYEA